MGMPVKDTIKVVSPEGFAVDTPDRNTLWQIQTPQVFRSDIISSAYTKCMRIQTGVRLQMMPCL